MRISLSEQEVARLGDLKLVPGMPAEAHFQTEMRTALAYVLKPLKDQLAKALK